MARMRPWMLAVLDSLLELIHSLIIHKKEKAEEKDQVG